MAVIARVFVAGRPRTKGHMEPVHVRGTQGRPCRFGSAKDRPLAQAWMKTLGRALQDQLGIRMGKVDVPGKAVRRIARVDAEPYVGAVEVHCFFRFSREESRREAAEAGEIIPSHDTPWPTEKSGVGGIGDEDTLRRAVLDALTRSGVIKDDSLSVGGMNYKRWCEPGEQAGVLIVVESACDPYMLLQRELDWGGER